MLPGRLWRVGENGLNSEPTQGALVKDGATAVTIIIARR